MVDDPVILAVDLGTSGMKVALVTGRGQVLGWESEPVHLILTPDGGAEQSPDEWWQAFLRAAKRLLGRRPAQGSAVRGICCSTQGEGTIPVDGDGNALMNCILWMDMRGAASLRRQFRGRINLDGVSLARIPNWVIRTGGMPSLTGKDPAAHMLLVRDRYPDVYARTYKFLNVLDYLNLRLTGRFTATYDSILTSWVTDNRNPDAVRYDPGLVRGSGIAADKFPEIVPCTAQLGPLRPEVAAELGLGSDVQVVAGAIDNTAAAVGAGAVADYAPHLYIGTSSWMAAHVPIKKTDLFASLASVPCALPGRYLLTALQATAGGNLTYLRDNILYHKDELLQEAAVPDIFKVLDQIAARVPAGANGVVYTPWIWGERAPVEDRTLRAGLYNLSLHNTRQDIIRAFLEGIALNTRWLLRPFERFLGRRVATINIVGGGAQSDVWCQIFADVMGVEIGQVADPIYANVRGAAWIAAAGLGEIAFSDLPELVQFRRVYQPDPNNQAVYDDRFAVFKQIYKKMKGVYKQMNAETSPQRRLSRKGTN
ncbi:MAG: FGGY-family carbohydrate kinase [Anaerolineales bacterium]|nr:FGGY-family carbohydrate kinase [Anaerolineales bacterium]